MNTPSTWNGPVDGRSRVLRAVDELLSAVDLKSVSNRELLGLRFDAGLAWVHFPPGDGGLALSPDLQVIVEECLGSRGVGGPDIEANVVGHGMAAPTIAAHGDAVQRARFLRPLFSNEEIWCQLFSEPAAGSDLANVAAHARRDGDQWVVEGQKVWTTLAHTAKWGLLLARTDASQPKHRGLTYFVVDMDAPGVDVRPLRQLTGDTEFNEVFLDGVCVPDSHRIGAEGDGWRVAMTTLMNERVAIGATIGPRGGGAIAHALRLWAGRVDAGAVRRDRLASLWIDAEVNRLTNLRALQLRRAGTPGPEGSVAKLSSAESNQRIYEFCVELLGAQGQLFPQGYEMARPERASLVEGEPRFLFLRTRANTIEGGTSEIMRNILGERVLGLPPEPRVDKDVPWKSTVR